MKKLALLGLWTLSLSAFSYVGEYKLVGASDGAECSSGVEVYLEDSQNDAQGNTTQRLVIFDAQANQRYAIESQFLEESTQIDENEGPFGLPFPVYRYSSQVNQQDGTIVYKEEKLKRGKFFTVQKELKEKITIQTTSNTTIITVDKKAEGGSGACVFVSAPNIQ